MDLKVNCDTLSEVSETEILEWNSEMGLKEDLTELATRIGLENVKDLHQQRVPVERRKLEHILIGDHQSPESGATFFHKIMKDTNTIINWPSLSNIRATRTDPHVTLSGRRADVQTAKKKILNALACNRVTIIMDVSYFDHGYIIGNKGANINSIREQTGCFIYFPGSSENNNQVEITGDIEFAEQARSCVRNLIPLMFRFELIDVCIPNNHGPYMKKLQQVYKVQILLHAKSTNSETCVTVKGLESKNEQVKQATCLLMEYMFGNTSIEIPIKTCIEISSHYHETVTGKDNENLNSIMKNTQTQITFLDEEDCNISRKKVVISGNIDSVYLARQQLLGSLPLVVMFDLSQEWHNIVTSEKLAQIQDELDVTINICHRLQPNCVIRGLERHTGNIYEARTRILDIIPFTRATTKAMLATSGCSHLKESSSSTASLKRSQIAKFSTVSSTRSVEGSHQGMPFKHSIVTNQPSMPFNTNNSTPDKYQSKSGVDPQSLKTLEFYQKREAGIRELLNKQEEGYQVSTSAMSGNGVSYTALSAPQAPDQDKKQASKIVIYSQGKRSEYPQSFTIPVLIQKRVAWIREMQNKQQKVYRESTSTGPGNGVSYTSTLQQSDQENIWKHEENQSSKNPMQYQSMHYDQQCVAGIRTMQNKHVEEYQVPPSARWGYGVCYNNLGALQSPDQDKIWMHEKHQSCQNVNYFQSNRNKYQKCATTPDFDQTRVAGMQIMPNNKEKGYRVSTSAGPKYRVSYNNIGALQLSDQKNIWMQEEIQACRSPNYFQNNCNEYHQSCTTPYFVQKRVAGVRDMQNKQEEKYHVLTSCGLGYGVSYNNLGALQLSKQEEDQKRKNLIYPQDNCNEFQESYSTTDCHQNCVAGIREKNNKQDKDNQAQTRTESSYGVGLQ